MTNKRQVRSTVRHLIVFDSPIASELRGDFGYLSCHDVVRQYSANSSPKCEFPKAAIAPRFRLAF